MTKHKMLASGICAILFAAAPSAAAQRDVTVRAHVPDDVLSEHVSYADLNLASAGDVKTLNSRVGNAVGRVCAPQYEVFANMSCTSFAWKGARPQIDLAVQRAQDIAANGTSAIAPVAISISANF